MSEREFQHTLARELARWDAEVVDLTAVLDDQIKVLKRMVEALRNEALGDNGVAVKNGAITLDTARKVKEVTQSLATATVSKINLDKSAALRAKMLTPEQRYAAFQAGIAALPYKERRTFIEEVLGQHNAAREKAVNLGLETVTSYNAPKSVVLY